MLLGDHGSRIVNVADSTPRPVGSVRMSSFSIQYSLVGSVK